MLLSFLILAERVTYETAGSSRHTSGRFMLLFHDANYFTDNNSVSYINHVNSFREELSAAAEKWAFPPSTSLNSAKRSTICQLFVSDACVIPRRRE